MGPACSMTRNCISGKCYDAGFGPCGACNGCCKSDGGCDPGTTQSSCGASGNVCQNCGIDPCVSGSCG
jgi:hypothetical protein